MILAAPYRARVHSAGMVLGTTALLLASQGAAAYSRPSATDAEGEYAVAAQGAWWASLGEAALNSLVAAAQRRARAASSARAGDAADGAPVEGQTAALYVAARAASVRLMMARSLQDSLARQKQLIMHQPPTRAAAAGLARLDANAELAQALVQHLAAQKAQLVASLAELCGVPAAELARVLQPALANPVAIAVAPAFAAVPPAPSAASWRDRPEAARLQASAKAATRLSEAVAARRMEVEAARRRVEVGEASEFELLESFQRLLADGDRLVTAQAALALEWIHLQADRGN